MHRAIVRAFGIGGAAAWMGLAGLASGTAADPGPMAAITVTAAGHDYRDVPLSAMVPAIRDQDPPRVARLESDDRRASLPAQVERTAGGLRVTWIEPALTRGQSHHYRLVPGGTAPILGSRSGVIVKPNHEDGSVEVLVNGALFLGYETRFGAKPFLFPLHGASGGEVSRNYPMKLIQGESRDHWHQRSCWFTHDAVNGVHFWNEQPGHGRQVHRGFEALDSGPVFGLIRTVNDWLGPDGQKVCDDTRDIRAFTLAAARMFDFDITVRATHGPVTFGDTKEGTFGIRVASSMDVDRKLGGQIVNSRGQRDQDAWGRKAEWVDYSGPVGAETLGITIMDHPGNLRHPTTWHVRTYGLFAANPFGLREFPDGQHQDGRYTIPAGGSLRFRYRVLIHSGRAAGAGVDAAWNGYAHPPRVDVQPLTGASR